MKKLLVSCTTFFKRTLPTRYEWVVCYMQNKGRCYTYFISMTHSHLLKRLREIEVIYEEKIILRSGKPSKYYCDIKKAFGYPDILNALADEVGKKLPKSTTCIAASGYGGIPIGSVVASRFNKKFVAVRSSEKNHGKKGLIDGYVPKEKDWVVIVDDVLTTGSSLKETLTVLKKLNTQIRSAIVIVERGHPKLPIPYSHVFTVEEIITPK